MTNDDVIKKLESMALPDTRAAGHRYELKASLLEKYRSIRTGNSPNGMIDRLRARLTGNERVRPVVWMVSFPLIIILAVVLSFQFSGVFSGISGVIDKACAAMERVESYRVISDAYIKSAYTDNKPVQTAHSEAEYAGSDKYRFLWKGSSIDSEMIVIGNQVFEKGYAITPQTAEQITDNLPNKQQTLDELDMLMNIETLEDEYVDGILCYHFTGLLDVDIYLEKMLPKMEEYYTNFYKPFNDIFDKLFQDKPDKPLVPSLEDSVKQAMENYKEYWKKYEYTIDYWIGKNDYLIRKTAWVRRPLSDPLGVNEEMITSARFYDFNEEILIQPPLTEAGELKEGWYELSMESFIGLK